MRVDSKNEGQFSLFGETDTPTPKHDKIMLWLEEWVRKPQNIKTLVKRGSRRYETTTYSFDEESKNALRGYKYSHLVEYQFRKEFEKRHVDVASPWPDEPESIFKFSGREWEPELYNERNYERTTSRGNCDMLAVYEFTSTIHRKVDCYKKLKSIEPIKLRGIGETWEFEDSSTPKAVSYDTETGRHFLYFEVKPSIPAIGTLMRQLNRYKGSYELKNYGGRLIVVAPPNNDAAAVVRSHGYGFVEYRPNEN